MLHKGAIFKNLHLSLRLEIGRSAFKFELHSLFKPKVTLAKLLGLITMDDFKGLSCASPCQVLFLSVRLLCICFS